MMSEYGGFSYMVGVSNNLQKFRHINLCHTRLKKGGFSMRLNLSLWEFGRHYFLVSSMFLCLDNVETKQKPSQPCTHSSSSAFNTSPMFIRRGSRPSGKWCCFVDETYANTYTYVHTYMLRRNLSQNKWVDEAKYMTGKDKKWRASG